MSRYFGKSNIYNTIDLIKTTSEIGVSLFRKTYSNIYFFKTLIGGKNIILSENDNFITISTGSLDNNFHRFIISGKTESDTELIKFKSDSPVLLTLKGKIGDILIHLNTFNDEFIGVHTQDMEFDFRYNQGSLSITHNSFDKQFDLFIEITSQTSIEMISVYNINSIM